MRDYISTKEKYLELKALQKKVAEEGKSFNNATKNYYQKRKEFYKAKGVNVPSSCDYKYIQTGTGEKEVKHLFKTEKISYPIGRFFSIYERDGFTEKLPDYITSSHARNLNIIYGIIRGKTHKQIESKVRENKEPSNLYEECLCLGFTPDETAEIFEKGGLLWYAK